MNWIARFTIKTRLRRLSWHIGSRELPAALKPGSFMPMRRGPNNGPWRTAWPSFPVSWSDFAATVRCCKKRWNECNFWAGRGSKDEVG